MQRCPDCQKEYYNGSNACANCEGAAAKNLAEQPTDTTKTFVEPVLLCSITDDINAKILVATLEDSGIPVILKRRGLGGYLSIYMAVNAFGLDIYVPSDKLKNAQEIFSSFMFTNNDQIDEPDEEFAIQVKQAARNKRIILWLILAVWLGIPGIIFLANHLRVLFF